MIQKQHEFYHMEYIFIQNLEHKIMKVEIIKVATFVCMVIVLGTQALLQGRWRVQESEALKRDR